MADHLKANVSFSDRVFSYLNFLRSYVYFLNLYRKRYKNFVSVIVNVLRNDYPIKATYYSGGNTIFNDYQEVYNNLMEIDMDVAQDMVCFNGLKFLGGKTNGDILHIFKMNEYSFLPVREKEVIDIGANIGDSSIYFANRGAKNVIAVEPDKISYDYAAKNIAINGFSENIKLILAACGSEDIFVSENEQQFLTLKTLVKKYCSCPQILKIDCEGCEYDLILNASSEDLRTFTHIQIEYHSGYQDLKLKLEQYGFEVTCTKPTFFIPLNKNRTNRFVSVGNVGQVSRMTIGWLYATRKKSTESFSE
jgi:Methyltransferase FkbM domain